MQEEISKYKFANSLRFLDQAVADTKPQHMIELGGWYGTIAQHLSKSCVWQSYTVYEAVTEIAQHLKMVVDSPVIVRNNTVAFAKDWRPVFNVEQSDTVSTSGLFTAKTERTIELAIGAPITPKQLVSCHAQHWKTSGFKSNIEGMDLDVVDQLLDIGLMPKFMLFEIFGRERTRLWKTIWPRLAQCYGIDPKPFTDLLGPVLHIGVYQSVCCWWTVLPDKTTPFNCL